MRTKIDEKEHTSQEDGTAPNLGGPTSNNLATGKLGINTDFETFKKELKEWAEKTIALYEGARQ